MENYKVSKTYDFKYYIKDLLITFGVYIVGVIIILLITRQDKPSTDEVPLGFIAMAVYTLLCFIMLFIRGYSMVFLNISKNNIKWHTVKDFKVNVKNYLICKRYSITVTFNNVPYSSKYLYTAKQILKKDELIVGLLNNRIIVLDNKC